MKRKLEDEKKRNSKRQKIQFDEEYVILINKSTQTDEFAMLSDITKNLIVFFSRLQLAIETK
jgi:hypothetical protein